jgi:hypothetical protein
MHTFAVPVGQGSNAPLRPYVNDGYGWRHESESGSPCPIPPSMKGGLGWERHSHSCRHAKCNFTTEIFAQLFKSLLGQELKMKNWRIRLRLWFFVLNIWRLVGSWVAIYNTAIMCVKFFYKCSFSDRGEEEFSVYQYFLSLNWNDGTGVNVSTISVFMCKRVILCGV